MISRSSYLTLCCRINLYDQVIKSFKLILGKVVHICNFVKNVLHLGRFPCDFPNCSKFLENLWADSGYGAFRLCAFTVIFTGCFHFHIFKGALGETFRNLTKNNFLLPNVAGWNLWLASCYFQFTLMTFLVT